MKEICENCIYGRESQERYDIMECTVGWPIKPVVEVDFTDTCASFTEHTPTSK
tara:strand:+ start:71 stop:229 length:159 start_codon:yes stop_codon:yes gene_type:complete